MKKLSSAVCLAFLFFVCFTACNQDQKVHGHKTTDKDTVKTTPAPFALACSEEYNKIYNPEALNNIQIREAYTETVGFYGPTVLSYLNGIDSLSQKDIVVVLGVYVDPVKYNERVEPKDRVNPKDYIGKVGRLTVFLWPKKRPGHGWGDCPECDPPLNLGEVKP